MKGARPNPILLGLLIVSVLALLLYPVVGWQKAEDRNTKLEQQVAELTGQSRGPQGPDGEPGRAPTSDEILAAVAEYCAASNLCVGPMGAAGANGAAGPQGAPGVSVGSVKCNGTSITFYSTTGQNLGSIRMVCIP
jgi:hypothetical protein